jgi:hypothetical protein
MMKIPPRALPPQDDVIGEWNEIRRRKIVEKYMHRVRGSFPDV